MVPVWHLFLHMAIAALRAADAVNQIVKFHVIAYDEGGYGDDRSREFSDEVEAVTYAQKLEPRFHAAVWRQVSYPAPHCPRTKVWPLPTPPAASAPGGE